METFLAYANLSPWEFVFLTCVVFAAGFVRGFTGFALSALAMVIAGPFLGPVLLIPILFWLELSSSLAMLRAGWAHADRVMTYLLVVGSAIAMPFGLWLTLSISKDASAIIALSAIGILALLQLAKVQLNFLKSTVGTFVAGMGAGVVTGLSGAGGMVVALFVLSSDRDAKTVRASLVLFLLLSSAVSFVTFVVTGVMTWQAVAIGLALIPICLAGVFFGQRLFVPKYEKFYRPVCLSLLIGLAALGLINRFATGA